MVVPAAASVAAAAAEAALQHQQQEQEQEAIESVPRGPLPTSLLVLAEALDGSLCPLINDLAQQLVQQLLLLHEEHPCLFSPAGASSGGPTAGGPPGAPSFSLEVEGRLGVIREKDSGARLQLPLATHAVLQPSFCMHAAGLSQGRPDGDGGPQARFVAGVSGAQFDDLKDLLLSLAAKNPRAAQHRLQTHLALMGLEPSGAPFGGPQDDSEDDGSPPDTAALPRVPWHLDGDDWRVVPEKETEENYYHIPALQAAARFSSLRAGALTGARGQGPRGGTVAPIGPPGGAPVSVQSLGQMLASPGIYKKNLLQWNVYTGADKDEAFRPTADMGPASAAADETAARTRVDYRLTINFEHKIEVKELQKSLMQQGAPQGAPMGGGGPGGYGAMGATSTEPQLRRLRLRQSLVHRSGLRIDLTKVQQQMKPAWGGGRQGDNRRQAQARWLYEVEIELHPMQIAKVFG